MLFFLENLNVFNKPTKEDDYLKGIIRNDGKVKVNPSNSYAPSSYPIDSVIKNH